MIMADLLHHYEAMLQRTIGTNTLYKGSEAFSRLLKKKGRTMLEVLVTFQQGFRDKGSDMPKFPDIHPNIDGFVRKHGHGFEIRACVVLFAIGCSLPLGFPARASYCGWRGQDPWMWPAQLHTRSCNGPSKAYEGFRAHPPLMW